MSRSSKLTKKLALATETLRVLDDGAIAEVVGGTLPSDTKPATVHGCWSERVAVCGRAPASERDSNRHRACE